MRVTYLTGEGLGPVDMGPILGGLRGIVAEAFDPETGILTLNFSDGTIYQTGDLRGPSARITYVASQEEFDAYVEGPNEIVVRVPNAQT